MRKFLSLMLALIMLFGSTIPTVVIAEGDIAAAEEAVDAALEEVEKEAAEEAERKAAEEAQKAAEEAERKAAEEAQKAAEEAERKAAEEAQKAAEEAERKEAEEAQKAAEEEEQDNAGEGQMPVIENGEDPKDTEEDQNSPAEGNPAEGTPTEETPAEGIPAEENEGGESTGEEPTGDETAEDEPEAFSKGYALARKDTKIYANAGRSKKLGTLDEDTVVYATELSEDKNALAILYAVDGEVKEAWLKAEDAKPLTEQEISDYEKETADAEKDGIQLKNAAFTAVSDENDGEETPADPADPTDPAAPEAPADPVVPVDPTDPEAPADPTDIIPVDVTEIVDDGETPIVNGDDIEIINGDNTEGEIVEEEIAEEEIIEDEMPANGADEGEPTDVETDTTDPEAENGEKPTEEETTEVEEEAPLLTGLATASDLVASAKWSDPVEVTAAYQSASKTVTVSFAANSNKAKSYKIVNTSNKKVLAEGIKVTGSKAPYKATAKITGLKDGSTYNLQIVPLDSKGKEGKKTTLKVSLPSNYEWKATAPVLANPDQNEEGAIEFSWTWMASGYPVKDSAISWKVVPTELQSGFTFTDKGSGKWSGRIEGVKNGKTYKIQVYPVVTQTSTFQMAGQSPETLRKAVSGTKATARSIKIDNTHYDVKWYAPVTILSARQTASKKVTIQFAAEKPADSYTIYTTTEAGKLSKATVKGVKVSLDSTTGKYTGTAEITGLAESAKEVKNYYFAIMPVKNGLEAKKSASDNHTRILTQVFKWDWLTEVPTIKVSQSADHKVKLTVTVKNILEGYEIMPYVNGKLYKGEDTIWGVDGTKNSSITLDNIANGENQFKVRIRKHWFHAEKKAGETEWEWIEETKTKTTAKKYSAVTKLTVDELWKKAPSNLHAMQMQRRAIDLRFTVKALPGNVSESEMGPNTAYYQVYDVTDSKNKINLGKFAGEKVVVEGKTVTISLPTQSTGKHIFQVQAVHVGKTHEDDAEPDNGLEKGTTAKVTVTVEKDSAAWKTAPNVISVEQTDVSKVTIQWRSNNGVKDSYDVQKYEVYEYNSTKETYSKKATVARNPDQENNDYVYEAVIKGLKPDASSSGTKKIYVVCPLNSKGEKGSYSNATDGTITLYQPQWHNFKLEYDPIGLDHTLKLRIRENADSKSQRWHIADTYLLQWYESNDISNGGFKTVTVGTDAELQNDDKGYYVEISQPLSVGNWQFMVQASYQGNTGRSKWIEVNIQEDYLLPPDVELSDEDGVLEITLLPGAPYSEKFPETVNGGYQVVVKDRNGGVEQTYPVTANGEDTYTVTHHPSLGGKMTVEVTAVVYDSDDMVSEQGRTAVHSTVVHTSKMIPDLYEVTAVKGNSVTIGYSDENDNIACEDLRIEENDDFNASFETGTITISATGESDGSITIYHVYDQMEPVEIYVHVISAEAQLQDEIDELVEEHDFEFNLTMKGPENSEGTVTITATAQDGTAVELVKDKPVSVSASVQAAVTAGTLPQGDWTLSAMLTVNGLESPVSIFDNEGNEITQISVGSIYTIIGEVKYMRIDEDFPYFSNYAEYEGKWVVIGRKTGSTASTVTVEGEIDGTSVVLIKPEAFIGDTNLVTIHLPDTIEVIGARAFKGCENLANMD